MTIEELKQALEEATKLFPAPWERDEYINQIYCAEDRGAVVADPRGWGHLTGFLGLDPDVAVAAQKANAHLIVEAVNNLPALLKVVEAAAALQVINTVIESRLSDELEDIERDVNAQEDAENALRKALKELNND